MCGIAGILPREPGDIEHLGALVRKMTGAMVHRGPDEEGFHVTPQIALGVRRLRIIDISRGQQPIFNTDRSKVIVFNGEIYNYRELRNRLSREGHTFRTNADTEVALKAFDEWGEPGFAQLQGMFALAVWDERRRTLTIARDCMGQKSVYHAETEIGWVFASEIKALLALDLIPRRVDFAALSHYMSLRYLPDTSTLFAGIRKLPSAHVLEVRSATHRVRRFWTPSYEPKWSGNETELLEELDRIMSSVVQEHLMSEVPLGAFLSGGIDSSLVVAYAARATSEPLKTFSIGVFDHSQSELPWARMVAERYKTEHREQIIEPDLAGMIPRMVGALEEPVDPFAAGVYVISQITSRHVTVALGGDGGDELFAGYDRYIGQEFAEHYSRIPAGFRRAVLRPLLRLVPENFGYKSLATKLRWLDRMAEHEGVARYAESAAFLRFPHALKASLFSAELWRDLRGLESEQLLMEFFRNGCAASFLDKMLHADCATRLSDHQLPILDRMSMAHTLEARSPFLDRRVAEFAMRIPSELKMRKRQVKYITRKLGERYLPLQLVCRSKQGFGFPLALWFRGELSGLLDSVIERSQVVEAGIFRREEMRRLAQEHLQGEIDHNYRLWMLLNIEMWYRHFISGTSTEILEDWISQARGLTSH